MTGYAAAATELPRGTLNLELRSVNSRYLDIQFRLADELRMLEPLLRELIAARLARGKIDCRMFFAAAPAAGAAAGRDPAALQNLMRLAAEVRRAFPEAAPLRVADVLRWPGVLAEASLDEERLRAAVAALAEHALEELCAARGREGAKLAALVAARVAEMRRRLAELAPLVPEALAAYQQKLAQRLREALGTGDDERIRAELAMFGMKTDVDEELSRLGAHL
ncbi:MAG: hypothetical protein M0015_15365, partial [Betaproteobacteria bacterium]|nr:hypothetical protein [Betaproteobacteria bacterium]